MKRDELTEILEQQFAKFAGQLIQHVDAQLKGQIQDLRTEMSERFDRLETMVDALAERAVSDEAERAAIVSEQNRHSGWINQLAEGTDTELKPPLVEY